MEVRLRPDRPAHRHRATRATGATGATRLIATALRRTGSWLGWWLNQTGHRAPMPPSRAFASSLTATVVNLTYRRASTVTRRSN